MLKKTVISMNLQKLKDLKHYLLNADYPIYPNTKKEIEEYSVYDGVNAKARPLVEGLDLISTMETLGETVTIGGTGISCYSFRIKIPDVGYIGYIKSMKIPSELEANKTVILWNNKTVLPDTTEHDIDDFIHIIDKHITGLQTELTYCEKEEKEYPVHHEEHEVIQTPKLGKSKPQITLDEALREIERLKLEVEKLNLKLSNR